MLLATLFLVVNNIVQHGCQKWEEGGGGCASKSVAPTMLLASCFQQPVIFSLTVHTLKNPIVKFQVKFGYNYYMYS